MNQILADTIDLLSAASSRADECHRSLEAEQPDQAAWDAARAHSLRVIEIINDVLSALETVAAAQRIADDEAQECLAALRIQIDEREAE